MAPPLPHRRGGLGAPSSSNDVSGSRSPNSLAIGPLLMKCEAVQCRQGQASGEHPFTCVTPLLLLRTAPGRACWNAAGTMMVGGCTGSSRHPRFLALVQGHRSRNLRQAGVLAVNRGVDAPVEIASAGAVVLAHRAARSACGYCRSGDRCRCPAADLDVQIVPSSHACNNVG